MPPSRLNYRLVPRFLAILLRPFLALLGEPTAFLRLAFFAAFSLASRASRSARMRARRSEAGS